MLRTLAFASLLFTIASAQNISAACETTLANVAENPDVSSCLNPSALLSIITSPNSSVITPVNTWLTGVCSGSPCSNDTLSAVITNVTSGCSSDLASLGLTSADASSIIATVQEAYPTARQILCLKDNSAGQLCATELLTDVQGMFGTLSVDGIVSIVAQAAAGGVSIPTNISCSTCSQAAYTVLMQNLPSEASSINTSACGSSFSDGTIPSSISLTASNSTTDTAKSGAAVLSAFNTASVLAISSIVAVSAGFTLFA